MTDDRWLDRDPPLTKPRPVDLSLGFEHALLHVRFDRFRSWPEGAAFRVTMTYEPAYYPRLESDRGSASPMFTEEGFSDEILFRTRLTTTDGRVFASAAEDFYAHPDNVELRLLDAAGNNASDWAEYWAPGLQVAQLRRIRIVWSLVGLDAGQELA